MDLPPADAPTLARFVEAFELFRDPILCALVAGSVLGFLSVYVVLRRMVFVSAAVTQSAALGVALAFFVEIHLGAHVHPVFGAAALSLAATLLLIMDPARLRLSRESLLGLAYALAGGATVLIGDHISQEAHDIENILFGTGVMVAQLDLAVVVTVAALTLALHLWWFRALTFISFDRLGAAVQGLPVRFLDAALMVSIGIMVGVSSKALGALPVFAFSTLSAVAALALDLRLPWTFALAALAGALAGVGGYFFAYFFEFPVGASQTVFSSVLVLLALGGRALHKLAGRAR